MTMFKPMDLYKGIVLACVVLLPVSLGFLWWIDGQREKALQAIRIAEQPKGELEKIGETIRKLETVASNSTRGGDAESYRLYFERMITLSSPGISTNDFQLTNENSTSVPNNSKAEDLTVGVSFKRAGKEFDLPRDFVHAVALNCESGGSQIWKLRSLKIRNAEVIEATKGRKAPPKTVDDGKWKLEKLEFARRRPKQRGA